MWALGAEAQRKFRTQEVVFVRDQTRSDSKQGLSEGRSGVAGAVREIPTSVDIRIVGDFAIVRWPVGGGALGASPKMSVMIGVNRRIKCPWFARIWIVKSEFCCSSTEAKEKI